MKWWSEMDGARTEPDRIDARADWSTVAGPDRPKSAVRCYFDGPMTFDDLYCGLVIADRRRDRGLLLSRATRDED